MSQSSSMKSSEASKPVSEMNQSTSKNDFQSLITEMENSIPKFRLNEPTFSAVNMKCQSNLSIEDGDDDSFVVLGKTSLDSINLASLADYEQIQQKCMNIDYNSIISNLSSEEIESKVAELMQENIKLKETVSRNNDVMKQHFNTLITWQNELIKVHGNHKQKFRETCNMISCLKQENTELKQKLGTTQSFIGSNFSGEIVENSLAQKQIQSIEGPSTITLNSNPDKDNSTQMNTMVSNLQDSKEKSCDCSETNRCLKIKEKLERDMHYQHEIIMSLKEQLRKLNENSFLSLRLQMESSLDHLPEKNRQQFFEHYTYYNEKLNDLAKCYAEQTSRFINIQDCLKRCIDLWGIDDDSQQLKSVDAVTETQTSLEACRKQLIEEQLLNISERQNLIKTHTQFQQIFTDYSSALRELEIFRDENLGPNQKDYVLLEQQKLELKSGLNELQNERKQIELEHKNMEAERLLFELEKFNLNKKVASFNSQSNRFDVEIKDYKDDMKSLQKLHDNAILENCALKEELENKNIELEGIRARLLLAKDDADTISHLQQQLIIYESDFQEERERKQELLREREELTEQLAKIRDHNQSLLRRMNGPNPAPVEPVVEDRIPVDAFCSECGLYKMPGQWHGPGFCQPLD